MTDERFYEIADYVSGIIAVVAGFYLFCDGDPAPGTFLIVFGTVTAVGG